MFTLLKKDEQNCTQAGCKKVAFDRTKEESSQDARKLTWEELSSFFLTRAFSMAIWCEIYLLPSPSSTLAILVRLQPPQRLHHTSFTISFIVSSVFHN